MDLGGLLPGPTAKGDMAPQCQWFKALGLLGSAGHFKVRLDEGSTETKVFELGFNSVEAGAGFDDLLINRPKMGDICLYSPLLGMREGAAVGMEGGCRSHKKGLVPGWQGLDCGGFGEVWLGMEDANGWGRGQPIVACVHSDASFFKELDPFCGAKDPVANGDDEIWVVDILNVTFWGRIKVLLIVEDVFFQSPDTILETQLFPFVFVVSPLDGFGKSLGDVCCEGEIGYALLIDLEGHKSGIGGHWLWDPVWVVEHRAWGWNWKQFRGWSRWNVCHWARRSRRDRGDRGVDRHVRHSLLR